MNLFSLIYDASRIIEKWYNIGDVSMIISTAGTFMLDISRKVRSGIYIMS